MVGNIYDWISEHYELTLDGFDPNVRTSGRRLCRRCGADVWYLTKHAVNVHGDSIEIMPSVYGEPTDHDGRLVEPAGV